MSLTDRMGEIDHNVAGAIILVSVMQAFADPEMLKSAPRTTFYKAGAATGLILGGLVLLMWQLAGKPLAEFGLFGWLGPDLGFTLLLAALWPVILIAAFWLCAGPLREVLKRYYSNFRHLMPSRRRELAPAYAAGSLAGAGEEIAFRGFLLWYVQAFTGVAAAVLLTSVLFGIAHGYQARLGMLFATVAGLILAGAYLLSGSLLLVLWMHASYNVASFTLGYRLLSTNPSLRTQ